MLGDIDLPEVKLFKKGKVRNVYDLGSQLLIVATDRISCFDVILPTPIPDKGKILTQLSVFWFSFLKDIVENHLISSDAADIPASIIQYQEYFEGRSMLAKKCEVIPFECVVRGYLAGSGWKEYKASQTVCGLPLAQGLLESQKLSEPMFTPATKAASGHDENVTLQHLQDSVGAQLAQRLKEISIRLYMKAAAYAESRGVIIADTKFEFGFFQGRLLLIDEALTPDSSRFWPREGFVPGKPQVSFDKQYVRDYLESLAWDKTPPAPRLPDAVVAKTRQKYCMAYYLLTGTEFACD